jgi:phytoene dehydrogenase-like protein
MSQYDALVIGAGHNGLVAAWRLARAGLKVRVVERRGIVGGAAVTEEFWPGFRNSSCSYTVSLLSPKVIAAMELARHGLRVVKRPLSNFLPTEDGRFLTGASAAEFAKFSAHDAEQLPTYEQSLGRVADLLRTLAEAAPPKGAAGVADLVRLSRAGLKARGLDSAAQRDALALLTRSAREVLEGWFESEPVKALFGFDSVVGHYASPSMPGSAYVLLHHVWGEVNGERGAWGHAIGGMGAITQAMAAAAREAGAEITTGAAVRELIVERGRAAGAVLEDGGAVRAPLVVSAIHPKLLFERLAPAGTLPADFSVAIARHRSGSGTLRINVALSALPRFTALPEAGPHLGAGIILAPSLDYMDRAYADAVAVGWSRQPIVEMLIPSTIDDSLAPPGQHVASMFCQQFAPTLPGGRSWDEARDAAVDSALSVVERFAPGFRESVVGLKALTPLDLERDYALLGGDIFHGRMSLDQLWAARPVIGAGDYRTPIRGLYLCGAGSHPGGGVTGLPGWNGAGAVLADRSPLPWRRWAA